MEVDNVGAKLFFALPVALNSISTLSFANPTSPTSHLNSFVFGLYVAFPFEVEDEMYLREFGTFNLNNTSLALSKPLLNIVYRTFRLLPIVNMPSFE